MKNIPDPTKAKEHCELFLKYKGKQIFKTSNESHIKSVVTKHPKSDSNLLKPREL